MNITKELRVVVWVPLKSECETFFEGDLNKIPFQHSFKVSSLLRLLKLSVDERWSNGFGVRRDGGG